MAALLFSTASEEIVLGGCVLDGIAAFDRVAGIVKTADFCQQRHQHISSAIEALAARSEPLDAVTLAEQLEKDDHLHDCGGLKYLCKLALETASTANIEWHAQRIAVLAKQRRIQAAAKKIADGDEDAIATLMREVA